MLRKLLSPAVLALSFAACTSAARATVVATCSTSVSAQGSNSLAAPTQSAFLCAATTFNVTQTTLPGYWEFTWLGTNGSAVNASIAGDSSTGLFFGALDLYSATDTLLGAASFTSTALPYTTSASLTGLTLTPGTQYIVGINANNPSDPQITINFNPAGPVVTPEPESFTLAGSGLALIGLLRRKLRRA